MLQYKEENFMKKVNRLLSHFCYSFTDVRMAIIPETKNL